MIYTENEVIDRMGDVCKAHNIDPLKLTTGWTNKLINFFTGLNFPSPQHADKFILYMLINSPKPKEDASKKQTVPAQSVLPAQQGKGHLPH